MKLTSMIAIYALFWVLSGFLVLPFGVHTHADKAAAGEDPELVPGQAESAPVHFRPSVVLKRMTVLSIVLFGLFYANYHFGWIMPQDLDWTGGPPDSVIQGAK